MTLAGAASIAEAGWGWLGGRLGDVVFHQASLDLRIYRVCELISVPKFVTPCMCSQVDINLHSLSIDSGVKICEPSRVFWGGHQFTKFVNWFWLLKVGGSNYKLWKLIIADHNAHTLHMFQDGAFLTPRALMGAISIYKACKSTWVPNFATRS